MNGLAAFAQDLQTAQSNPSVIIDLPDEGQETILDFEWPPFGTILRRSVPIYHPHLLTQEIAVSDPTFYRQDLVYGLSPTGVTASAVSEKEYRAPLEISLLEAQVLALRDLREARERRRVADEAEAKFISEFLDEIEEESEQ